MDLYCIFKAPKSLYSKQMMMVTWQPIEPTSTHIRMRSCGFSVMPEDTTAHWGGEGFEPPTSWPLNNLLFLLSYIHFKCSQANLLV